MNGLPDKDQETLATALTRGDGDSAQVLAQGRGAAAGQMTALAGKLKIPVLQDFALSQALQRMPVGTRIPDPLFRALSALLEFVFRQEEELARQDENEP